MLQSVRLKRTIRLQRPPWLDSHAAHLQSRNPDVARLPVRKLAHRNFRASRPVRLLGLKLPEPTNEPLAGTVPDGSGPPWLFLLQVVVGLPTALWAYKCVMLVLFQRRIIYLPSVPPGTRDERVPHQTGELAVKEVRIQSEEPSRWLRRTMHLRGIEVEWGPSGNVNEAEAQRCVVIVYLQGNAGTPLLRLPVFRKLLKPDPTAPSQPRITLLAVAPRSYWLSDRTTPTERGVLADYRAALAYAQERYGPDATYVLYGHSLGGAAAVLLLLRQLARESLGERAQIAGLILENPLPSIPYMVRALYPQRWLPYHYLGPFAFDKWDALSAIEQVVPCAGERSSTESRRRLPPSLWVRSGRDEIIPRGGASDGVERMYAGWRKATEERAEGLDAAGPASTCVGGAESDGDPPKQVRPTLDSDGDGHELEQQQLPLVRDHVRAGRASSKWIDISHALHDTAYTEQRWRDEIRRFLDEVSSRRRKAG